jgi:release factor glutamine methyltransferase
LSEIVARLRSAGSVFAEEEGELLVSAARTPAELDSMLEQRAAGLPLEPILGWAEFCGLRIAVQPGVFVPRRRTEFLVRQAAALGGPFAVVVDVCCGSGAVGTALASLLGRIELHAVDIDPAAVRCARRNIVPAGGRVYEGDLYAPLPPRLRGRVDLLVANAPYVPTEAIQTMPPEARVHEPRVTLDGGIDGLDVQRRLAETATTWLASDGYLLVETSSRQAPASLQIFADVGLLPRLVRSDELDATVVIATRPQPPSAEGSAASAERSTVSAEGSAMSAEGSTMSEQGSDNPQQARRHRATGSRHMGHSGLGWAPHRVEEPARR